MVCIAAFIILFLMSGVVGFLSIFKREIGKKYWVIFKKAWGCVGKRVTLQKCETNFKDDVKNSILKHFVLKKPKMVKPISIGIEAVSVLIVVVTLWSVVEGAKAGLSLFSLGTCNVSKPSSCSLSVDVCAIDRAAPTGLFGGIARWFEEWGEIFVAFPDAMKKWDAKDYLLPELPVVVDAYTNAPIALDVIDPLCTGCTQAYKKQKETDFHKKYNTYLMFYPIKIKGQDGTEKLKYNNSEIIAKYLYAVNFYEAANGISANNRTTLKLVNRIFTEFDSSFINYQTVLERMSETEAVELLKKWILEFNPQANLDTIKEIAEHEKMNNYLAEVKKVVYEKIGARGIPTLIYGGRKYTGMN